MTIRPPRYAAALLDRVAPRAWQEHLSGDLDEEFAGRVRTSSPFRARWWYRGQVARVLLSRMTRPRDASPSPSDTVWARLWSDVVSAWRAIRRQPRHAALVVIILGGSLGTSALVLTVVDAYLWRPLPYPSIERLYWIGASPGHVRGPQDRSALDHAALGDIADLTVAMDIDGFTIVGESTPQLVLGNWITAEVFSLFGIQPQLGRVFTADDVARATPIAVISHRLWQTRYGGDPAILGRALTIRGVDRPDETVTFTIVGVLPPRFWHLDDRTDILVPLRGPSDTYMIRLRENISPAEAHDRLQARIAAANPDLDPRWTVTLQSLQERHVETIRAQLEAVAVGVALLLLVACANLAMAQTVRTISRDRELAIRTSLGAGQGRLLCQLGAESIILAAGAVALACILIFGVTGAALPLVESYMGRIVPGSGLQLSGTTLALMMAVACTTTVLLGLAPLRGRFSTETSSLSARLVGHSGVADTPARASVRHLIVGVQVAATMTLLVGATLMIQSAWHLGRVPPGFNPAGVLNANLEFNRHIYPTPEVLQQAIDRVLTSVEALPEVESASLMTGWAFGATVARPVSAEAHTGTSTSTAMVMAVTPSYFKTLGIAITDGRAVSGADTRGQEPVAVISAALAQALWADGRALGRMITTDAPPAGQPRAVPGGRYRVIGVASNVTRRLRAPAMSEIYVPMAQAPQGTLTLHVRSRAGTPLPLVSAVTRAIAATDQELPLNNPRPLEDVVAGERARPRFLGSVLAGFATLSALVALVGVYAISAWIARHRRREAAIRLALGARPFDVVRAFTLASTMAIVIGLGAGWVASLGLARLLSDEFSGVSANDLLPRAAVAALLLATSVVAIMRPARAVAKTDAASVLRE